MRKKSTLLALSVSALLLLGSCDPARTSSSEESPVDTTSKTTPVTDTTSDTDSETTPTITVDITSTVTEVETEGTLTLTATVTGAEGAKATWAIKTKTPAEMDASIGAETGVLNAGTVAGTLVVTATYGGVSDEITITVKEAPKVTTVKILGAPTEAVYTGREVKLDAYVSNGPSGYTVDWTCTTDPADMGATVDANGKVTTGSKPGKITVTATVGDAKDSVTITVVEAPVVDITTTVTEVTMGSTLQLAATITNGEEGAKPTWAIAGKTPETMDATIDPATGLLTAGKVPGKLTVTAAYEDAVDSIEITIPAPAFATDVFPASYKMTIGDSYFELVQGKGMIKSDASNVDGYILVDEVLYKAAYDEKQGYVYRLDQPLSPDDMTVDGAFATYDLNADAAKYVYDSTDPTTGNHTYVINLADTKVGQVAARIGIDPETAKAVVDHDGDLVSFAFVDEGKDIAATITAVDDLSEEYKAYVGIDITNAPANLPTNSEYKLGLTLTGVSEEDIQWSVKTEDGMNATIDQDGTLHTGSVAGKVTVTASDGAHSTSVDIMVQLVTVTIGNVPTEGVYTGEDIALIANVVNSEETPVWSIEMTEGMDATIDQDGRLHTGTVGGTITVTVRLPESDYSDTVEIVVKEYLPDGGETDEGIGEEW